MCTRRNQSANSLSAIPARVRLASVGLVTLAVHLACPSTHAVGAPTASPDRDRQLTFLARQTLMQDTNLAPYNLGVTVRDRVAILWGAVPSVEHGRRAESRLRAIPDLLGVRNEFRIEVDDDHEPVLTARPALPPPQAVSPPAREATGSDRGAEAAPKWGPPRTVHSEPARAGKKMAGILTGAAGMDTPARAPHAAPVPFERAPSGPEGRARWASPKHVEDLPAISIPVPRAPSAPRVNVQDSRPVGKDQPVEQLIQQLQRRELPCQGIQWVVQGGLVYVRREAARSNEIGHFAQAVAELPGVERVILINAPAAARSRP